MQEHPEALEERGPEGPPAEERALTVVTPTAVEVVEQPASSFADLVSAFHALDELMDDPNFDPAKTLGLVFDKVDSLDYVVEALEFYEAWKREQAKRATKRAQSAKGKVQRLKDYVLFVMRGGGFDTLPGHQRIVSIKTSGTPQLNLKRGATAEDALTYPNLVDVVPRTYQWNTAAVVKYLKDLPEDGGCDFATLEYSQSVHWKDKTGVPEKKPKAKRKPAATKET